MKVYEIRVSVSGTKAVEGGPSWWKGSHIYDEDVPVSGRATLLVFAGDEAKAKELASDFCDYDDPGIDEVKTVEIDGINFVEDDPTWDEEFVEVQEQDFSEPEEEDNEDWRYE